jgi:hypothetical protein
VLLSLRATAWPHEWQVCQRQIAAATGAFDLITGRGLVCRSSAGSVKARVSCLQIGQQFQFTSCVDHTTLPEFSSGDNCLA